MFSVATRGDGALTIVSACHFDDGGGGALLRALARLTSFGGYVATGVVAGEAATLPRHVAMAPSPSHLPAISHDGEGAVATGVVAGEGAPLLRPLARLTSFGGYVATGVVAGEGAPLLQPLARLTSFGDMSLPPTTIYQLPTTNCHYQLPSTNYLTVPFLRVFGIIQ